MARTKLRRLFDTRLESFVDAEAVRGRARVDELREAYPSASSREIAQHLISAKKTLAATFGGVTGVFGLITIPVDLAGMLYMELALLVEIAIAYRVPVKTPSAKEELLELFRYVNGVSPAGRSAPRIFGDVSRVYFLRRGFTRLSTAVPLVAAPVTAYVNNRHIQRIGEAAIRHYEMLLQKRASSDA